MVKENLFEQFQKLQQQLRLAQTEEEAKRINQQLTILLDLLEDRGDEV